MEYIVYKSDATLYEISVVFVDDKNSDYDQQYVVSLVNFGECFFDSDLNFIGEAILRSSKLFGGIDARNIQNAIAGRLDWVKRVDFDHATRRLINV